MKKLNFLRIFLILRFEMLVNTDPGLVFTKLYSVSVKELSPSKNSQIWSKTCYSKIGIVSVTNHLQYISIELGLNQSEGVVLSCLVQQVKWSLPGRVLKASTRFEITRPSPLWFGIESHPWEVLVSFANQMLLVHSQEQSVPPAVDIDRHV